MVVGFVLVIAVTAPGPEHRQNVYDDEPGIVGRGNPIADGLEPAFVSPGPLGRVMESRRPLSPGNAPSILVMRRCKRRSLSSRKRPRTSPCSHLVSARQNRPAATARPMSSINQLFPS